MPAWNDSIPSASNHRVGKLRSSPSHHFVRAITSRALENSRAIHQLPSSFLFRAKNEPRKAFQIHPFLPLWAAAFCSSKTGKKNKQVKNTQKSETRGEFLDWEYSGDYS